jgi:hypothetical protein
MNYRRRRGMGDGSMVNGVYVMTTPITTDTVTSSGTNVYTDSSGNITVGSGSSLTSWLNQNSTLAIGIAVAVVGLLFVAKAGR